MEMLINYVFFMYFSGEQPSFMVVGAAFDEIIDIIILIISNGMGIRVYSVLSLFMSHRLFSRYKRFLLKLSSENLALVRKILELINISPLSTVFIRSLGCG